jgi:plasmid stabilization system protein ParE
MKYKILWTDLALISFYEEIDFIFLKWNLKEVEKFNQLTLIELERLSLNPTISKVIDNNYSLALSKQTTLYFKITEELKTIELLFSGTIKKIPKN